MLKFKEFIEKEGLQNEEYPEKSPPPKPDFYSDIVEFFLKKQINEDDVSTGVDNMATHEVPIGLNWIPSESNTNCNPSRMDTPKKKPVSRRKRVTT